MVLDSVIGGEGVRTCVVEIFLVVERVGCRSRYVLPKPETHMLVCMAGLLTVVARS